MRQKEKWAEDVNPYINNSEKALIYSNAWLAGFEFAKKELDKMFNEIKETNDSMKIAMIIPKNDHAILDLGEETIEWSDI